MLKEAPSSSSTPPVIAKSCIRAPYFFQDPLRLSAMACAVLLMVVKDVPWSLALFAIGLSQLNAVAMVIDLVTRGWSMKLGKKSRTALLVNSLAMDWTNMSICTLLGAMLLMRFFGPPELVTALGLLALGISLLPDIRLCRMILPNDPKVASTQLEQGYFFRDPVKLGGLAALMIIMVLDRTSLVFVFASMALLQVNSVLILIDKYVTELESSAKASRFKSLTLQMVLARDGQRFLLTLMPTLFVPLRLLVDDATGRWAAATLAGIIIVPDILRFLGRMIAHVFGFGIDRTAMARASSR